MAEFQHSWFGAAQEGLGSSPPSQHRACSRPSLCPERHRKARAKATLGSSWTLGSGSEGARLASVGSLPWLG